MATMHQGSRTPKGTSPTLCADFGYTRVTVERPLHLRYQMTLEDKARFLIDAYFKRAVRLYVPDAWMDCSKDKVSYEINFNRHFYKHTPPRPLEVNDAELRQAEEEVMRLLREVAE